VDPRSAAQDLLFREAYLLDTGAYRQWLDLFAEGGRYWVPANHDDIDPDREVSIIYDGPAERLLRVKRLESDRNLTQDPPVRMRHFVTNVWIDEPAEPASLLVHSNQLIFQTRRGQDTQLPAHCRHRLVHVDDRWLIASKKLCLLHSDQPLAPAIGLL
jgi:3-phenylpropionate/cinnamic acid dioxygenase small subunit